MEDGRPGDATEYRNEARRIASVTEGWQKDHVLMAVAQVDAMTGNSLGFTGAQDLFRGNRDYLGQLAAHDALRRAREGSVDEAFGALDALAEQSYYDIKTWRAQGFLNLIEFADLTGSDREKALQSAWDAAALVPGWKQWELQLEVIDLLTPEAARPRLEEVTEAVAGAPLPGHIKAPLLGYVAVRWGMMGNAERTAELVARAETIIASDDIQNIERPAALALLGEASMLAQSRAEAERLYGQALSLATELVNPRPRALAAVDIALSLDRCAFDSASCDSGLQRLLATFRAA
jgi:hypothetical protein